jgi:hypothetical protein
MRFALVLLVAASLAAESVTENYPDGSKSLTVTVDKEGRRNGALTAWWPGGKIVKEKSKWDDGVRHGLTQTFDEKGKLLVEETWIKGRLIYPRAQVQIVEAFARIERETQAYVAALPKPVNPGSAPPADQAQALARLRQYRNLCGLDHDVLLDPTYTDEAQEGAEILAAIGKLDHHPSKPTGWSDADYAKAKNACGHGNLAMGAGSLIRAVDMWMDDSDASNIGALGHRRWMLNPVMQSCGFGISGKFQVIWAHDDKRSKPVRQQWQAFPPPGFVPASHFGDRHAWHISLNPADYSVDLKTMTFQIFPLDQRLVRSGAAYVLDHDGSEGSGYGCYKNARIVRPAQDKQPKGQPPYVVGKNRSYEAVVGGLSPKGDAPKELTWVVSFY